MAYYPIPDIPSDATPAVRRFCEQVRTVIAGLEGHGQAIEVHQPFYAEQAADLVQGADPLDEFPVYRADSSMELLEAYWTTPFSGDVVHNLLLRWRAGDGGLDSELVASIMAASVNTTDWRFFRPKRFELLNRSRRILKGQILTLAIQLADDGADFTPYGLLSLYLRKARDN